MAMLPHCWCLVFPPVAWQLGYVFLGSGRSRASRADNRSAVPCTPAIRADDMKELVHRGERPRWRGTYAAPSMLRMPGGTIDRRYEPERMTVVPGTQTGRPGTA